MEKIVPIKSGLNETLRHIDKTKDNIASILVFIQSKDGYLEFFNTHSDLSILYSLHRVIRLEMETLSEEQYPLFSEDMLEAIE